MPLEPPWMRIDSPGFSRPRSNTFVHTVKNVSGMAAAATKSNPRGTGRHWGAGATQYSAYPPPVTSEQTRSPARHSWTPGPVCSMVPAISRPGMWDGRGGGGYLPSRWATSGRFTPAAAILTRTSPDPGAGVGRSAGRRTSGSPGSLISITVMGVVIIIMGAAGAGKTTVGKALAAALGWPFVDADDQHPVHNIEKMRAGVPLSDTDRAPWIAMLRAVVERAIDRREHTILACSALKERDRHTPCGNVRPGRFGHLHAVRGLLEQRLAARALTSSGRHWCRASSPTSRSRTTRSSLTPPGRWSTFSPPSVTNSVSEQRSTQRPQRRLSRSTRRLYCFFV